MPDSTNDVPQSALGAIWARGDEYPRAVSPPADAINEGQSRSTCTVPTFRHIKLGGFLMFLRGDPLMTFLRKILVAGILVLPLIAYGADVRPYSDETFAELQAAEAPILVDVYADWCPTCRRQGQILDGLLSEPKFADLVVLKLNWDEQRETALAFGAPRQSTFIVFRGDEERGRSVADTRPDSVRALLQTVVAD